MRHDLKVPFAEKDQAKKLGARWDAARKCWYIDGGLDPAVFARWQPMPHDAAASRRGAPAGAEGKVIPLSAEQIEACDVAILSAMVDQLPAGEVPKKLPGTQTTETAAASVVALSADEKSAARALGLTEEEYRKAKPQA